MISLSDFSVGQTVVVCGEHGRRDVRRATVEAVGRKYVTISGGWGTKFYINHAEDDCLTEQNRYGAPASLFPSERAYAERVEQEELKKYVRKACDWPYNNKLSLDQLRRIAVIIQENERSIELHDAETEAGEK